MGERGPDTAELALAHYDDARLHLDELLQTLPKDGAVDTLNRLNDGIKLLTAAVDVERAAPIRSFIERIDALISTMSSKVSRH